MISKILMTTDGSEVARKSVEYAIELARQIQGSIILLKERRTDGHDRKPGDSDEDP